MEAARGGGAGGSAWNKGGSTWEEKRINTWAHDTLKDVLLPELGYELPGASGSLPNPNLVPKGAALSEEAAQRVCVRVLSAESVTGECTYVLSRGKQRVVFELTIKLQVREEGQTDSRLAHGTYAAHALSPSPSPVLAATCLPCATAGDGAVRWRRAQADTYRQAKPTRAL